MQSSNPKLIILDSSVALQLIATDQLAILRRIKQRFSIQSAVVDAVASEILNILENVPKFRGRQEQFRKAVTNVTIATIDHECLRQILGVENAESWIRQIQSEGLRLYQLVDRGEAFSHAASSILNVPIATNDITAVRRLLRDGDIHIPRPILRFWDLLVLAYQSEFLEESDCDSVRQTLRKIGERLHPSFQNAAFCDGLRTFFPRLQDSTRVAIGAATPQETWDERRLLQPTSDA